MAHYGVLRDYRFEGQTLDDIRGANIYNPNDDKLGKIDDVIFDHTTGIIRYVVVDTGGWLSSERFIVPADRLRRSAKHADHFEVDLTKDQIKSFPSYDEETVESSERWQDYEMRYRAAWTDSPVQHRQGSDRNVTPQVVSRTGADLGSRWQSFEERLRRERPKVVAACGVCREPVRKVS